MSHIITRKLISVEQNHTKSLSNMKINREENQNWIKELASAYTDPIALLEDLEIDPTPWLEGLKARHLFAQRIPLSFVRRMQKKNINDPLLRQVLPTQQEFEKTDGFTEDPLLEKDATTPSGLLHKYNNRVLFILKAGCAVNCRYCFRRHFPYQDFQGNRQTWQKGLDYIGQHVELDEVILSGGDPLMAKDHELKWLIEKIEAISHIKTLRIHTRLPVVIPNRITDELCLLLSQSRLQIVCVTHINHANEINGEVCQAIALLKASGVTLLNQSVLLKGVNDNAQTLADLSQALFQAGILPYYLHVLDKVQGAAHFLVCDQKAKAIMKELLLLVSGYLVPKLTREIAGEKSKTPLDLRLKEE